MTDGDLRVEMCRYYLLNEVLYTLEMCFGSFSKHVKHLKQSEYLLHSPQIQ
jgi:hypothetical protein